VTPPLTELAALLSNLECYRMTLAFPRACQLCEMSFAFLQVAISIAPSVAFTSRRRQSKSVWTSSIEASTVFVDAANDSRRT
jgi:non-ribosomal peptide synthetase component E (peptide arylation enzyme)